MMNAPISHSASRHRASAPAPDHGTVSIVHASGLHCLEAGSGPLVVLVHSSMAGARQWSSLIGELKGDALVRAVNLFGYGATPAWSKSRAASLDDFAALVAGAVPATASGVHLVGHSLGGAIAMHAAAHQLRGRVASLTLIEPSLFFLLAQCGSVDAYCEIATVLDYAMGCVREGLLAAAAECFIDYWQGVGSWAATPEPRRLGFARMASLMPPEAAALLHSDTDAERWIATLPRDTLLISSLDTTRPSAALIAALGTLRPDWACMRVGEGGHMAPVTHPQLVNPLVRAFIAERIQLAARRAG
jgi:pimeloyl-ACP methyl ester carboxylesterase